MLREENPMTEAQARLLSPLQLAYIGDTVWDLLVRCRLLWQGRNVHHMHQEAVRHVNAAAQCDALHRIEALLTPEENAIAHRGRNAHPRHHAPKNQQVTDYAAATGLEAVIGYLHVTGQEERLLSLFRASQEEENPCPQ